MSDIELAFDLDSLADSPHLQESVKNMTADQEKIELQDGIIKESTENKEVSINMTAENSTKDHPEESEKKRLGMKETFTIVNLCIAGLSVGVYYAVLGPFFPQEAALKGMSSTLIGVVFSEFELIIVFMSPLYGAFLTKIGAKHLYVMGLTISGGSSVLFGILEYCPPGPLFTIMCIIVRTVEACGTAGYSTASYAIMVNTFPDKAASMMGTLSLFMGFGFTVAPPLGGALYKAGGFKTPFLFSGSVNIIMGALSLFFLPNQDSIYQQGGSKMFSMLRLPVVLLMVLAICASYVSVGLQNVGLALRLRQVYQFTPAIIGVVFLALPSMYAIATPLWGYIADRLPRHGTLLLMTGFLSAGIGLLFLGPAPFLPIPSNLLWLLILSLAGMGFGIGSVVTTFQVMSIAATDAGMPQNLETFGVISGLYTMSLSIGGFIGPLLAGYLIDTVEFEWTTFIFACMMFGYVLMLALYVVFVRPCQKSSKVDILEKVKEEDRCLVLNDEENVSAGDLMSYGSTDNGEKKD